MEKFVLVNGYISINNTQLFLDINKNKNDLKERGGWLGVLFSFVALSVYNNLRDVSYFENLFHYFDFGLRILGGLAIIAIFYYLLFLRKSKKNLIINEVITVSVEKKEFETEVTLIFSNKREQDVVFRNLENQIEPFLEQLKKRNSRIKIEQL